MNEERLRAEFEKWYTSNNIYCDFSRWNEKEFHDNYKSKEVQSLWGAWKTAAEFAYNEGVGDGKGY